MTINIISKQESGLLFRTVINANLDYSGPTPSTQSIKSQLASNLKADEKLIVVKNIKTGFGGHSAKITAYVYNTDDDLKKYEPKLHKKQIEKIKKQESNKEKLEENTNTTSAGSGASTTSDTTSKNENSA